MGLSAPVLSSSIQRSGMLGCWLLFGSYFIPSLARLQMRLSPKTPAGHLPRRSTLATPRRPRLFSQAASSVLCQADQIPDWKLTISTPPKWLSLTQRRGRPSPRRASQSQGPCVACRKNHPSGLRQRYFHQRLGWPMYRPTSPRKLPSDMILTGTELAIPSPSWLRWSHKCRGRRGPLTPNYLHVTVKQSTFHSQNHTCLAMAHIWPVAVSANPTRAILFQSHGKELAVSPKHGVAGRALIYQVLGGMCRYLTQGQSRPTPSLQRPVIRTCTLLPVVATDLGPV